MNEFDLSQANNINVDTGQVKSDKTTAGGILKARADRDDVLKNQVSTMLSSANELSKVYSDIERKLNSINKLEDDKIKKQLQSKAEYKNLQAELEKINKINGEIAVASESGNITAKQLNDLTTRAKMELLDTKGVLGDINDLYDDQNKVMNDQNNKLKSQKAIRAAIIKQEKDALKEEKKQVDEIINKSNKSAKEAFTQGADKLRKTLSDFKGSLDLSRIARAADQSTSSKLQVQLQRAFGLNKSQFKQFKRANEKSINSDIYSYEDRMSAHSSFQQIGIGNADTATKYYNTLIQGQSLLGMSVDTQKQLYTLQRLTGNESLKFMTQKVAKYMTTATNLSKDQLNELVSVNANTAQQAVDYGVDSQEFMGVTNDFTTAMSNLTGDKSIASKYQNVVMQSLSDSQTAAQYYGKDVGSLQDFWNSGGNFLDLLESTNGTAGEWFRKYLSNFEGTKKDATYAVESGVLDRSTNSLIQQLAKLQLEGKDIRKEMQKFNSGTTGEEAIKEIEKQQKDSLSFLQKMVNNISGVFFKEGDWDFESKVSTSLEIIIALLTTISVSELFKGAKDLFSGLKGLFGKGKTALSGGLSGAKTLLSGGANLLTGGKVGTALTKATAKTATKAVGKVAAPLTFLEMGVDAFQGYSSTSQEMYGKDATTGQKVASGLATAVSSSKVHTNKEGKVSVGKNTAMGVGSGALKGAAIGALAGPVGAAIGAGIGGLLGGIGGWFKGKKAKKQEELQEKQLEEEKKIAENTQTTSEKTASLYQAIATSNKEVSYVPRASGAVPNITFHGSSIHKSAIQQTALGQGTFSGTKGDKLGPWFVTSPYGTRKDPITGATKFHGGIDLSLGGTQEIYAPFGGTVKHITQGAKEGFGPYGLAVVNGDKTFYFGHMKARYPKDGETISAGTHVGTMGNFGYSTGQHLHYQVNQNGHSIDPVPYATDSLWDGTPGTGLSNSSDSSASSTNASELYKKYVVKLGTGGMGDPNGGVISGLDRINQTLIDLSNRQTQQEQIMNMLAGKKKPDPTF